jgi:hypothetical protein
VAASDFGIGVRDTSLDDRGMQRAILALVGSGNRIGSARVDEGYDHKLRRKQHFRFGSDLASIAFLWPTTPGFFKVIFLSPFSFVSCILAQHFVIS